MAKNYVGKGSRINIPANTITSAVSAGALVTVNKLVGVALHDGEANAANVLKVDGEFTFTKDTGAGTGGALGVDAYVTATGTITAISAGNTKVGLFTLTAGDNDTIARVRLNAVGIV